MMGSGVRIPLAAPMKLLKSKGKLEGQIPCEIVSLACGPHADPLGDKKSTPTVKDASRQELESQPRGLSLNP
jgi:hypothetical protein